MEREQPAVMGKSGDFLRKRTRPGEQPQKLRELTGNPRYGNDEVAIEDHFKDFGGTHYSGRKYPDGSTEVLTTGIERLHADPARFAVEDPGYFSFVVNTLRNW